MINAIGEPVRCAPSSHSNSTSRIKMPSICITDNFQSLDKFGHKIQQMAMPIVAGSNGEFTPVGTGFTITPGGLMMTATHVLQEAHERCGGDDRGVDISNSRMELYALYVTSEKHSAEDESLVGGMWPIRRVWFGKELDIALCWLAPATRDGEPITFPVARLSPGLPVVGDNILGFGYHKMVSETERSVSGQFTVNYKQDTAFTKGQVSEVFPLARDAAMLNFPVFRTDARFDPGMSGGPIFNEKGCVCGVVCSSLPAFCDDQQHISYGSLIWPALGSTIDAVVLEGQEPERLQLNTLVERQNILVDESIRDVTVTRKVGGTVSVMINVNK